MKKTFLSLISMALTIFLLNGCGLKHSGISVVTIQWPDKIEYMEAIGELDISWKDLRYSGEMSLKLDYPESFFMEVYGPFGNTLVTIEKDTSSFLMTIGSEQLKTGERFREIFKMKIEDFIDDIAMRGEKKRDSDGTLFVQRKNYMTFYTLNDPGNKICWIGSEGRICAIFFEATFDKGQSVGKTSNKSLQ